MSDEKIRAFLKEHGPSTPAQLCKHLETSLLFASAMLSQVASQGDVKISKLKIGGGSPLYYLKEDVQKLEAFAKHLPPKEFHAYEMLKERKILRDTTLEPITRVALRNVRDFAVPLTIIRGEIKELFWKWYSLSEEEAKEGIRKILAEDTADKATNDNRMQETAKESKENEEYTPKINQETEKQEMQQKKVEIPERIEDNKQEIKKQPQMLHKESRDQNKQTQEEEKEKSKQDDQSKLGNNNSEKHEKQRDLLPLLKERYKYPFAKRLLTYFEDKGITIVSATQQKKTEFNFIVRIPAAVGSSRVYAKAIDKKRITEGDIALALVEGQYKHLPTVLFITGEMNKRTKELQETIFEDMTIEKI